MVDRLTDDEMRRIQNFARTPAHARDPEQLLPEGAETDATDPDGDSEEELLAARSNTHRRR
jgi:hypothetical protein